MRVITLSMAILIAATSVSAAPVSADANLQADEQLLRSAGIGTDGPALLDFFRKRTLTEMEQARLADSVRRLGDNVFAVREKASAELTAAGRLALPFLRQAVKDPDLEISRRAERCLHAIERGSEIGLVLAAGRLLAVRKP